MDKISSIFRKINTNIFLVIGLIVFYSLLFKPTEKNIFSISFVDEDDNFTVGKWLLRDKKIYRDFFFQHQPITPIISSVIQKTFKPNSLFLLIKRHREFVFFLSAFSFIILTLKFGYPVFFTALFYETSKFAIFGNLLLSESLVIPAIIYLLGMLVTLIQNKIKTTSHLDLFCVCFSLTYIAFSLLPLAPFVICTFISIVYLLPKKRKKFMFLFSIILALLSIICFYKIMGFNEYFKDTIFINAIEFIPREVKSPFPIVLSKIFFSPFISLTLENTGFYLLLKITSIVYLTTSLFLLLKKSFKIPLISFIFLALLNSRAVGFNLFYNGFHLLPFYSGLLFLTIYQLRLITGIFGKIVKNLFFFGILFTMAVFFLSFGYKEYTRVNDQYNNWYINYSPLFDYGEAIRLLSYPNDNMLAVPGASLVYWQSGLFSSSPYFFTYNFMYESPQLSSDLDNKFRINPPRFLYSEDNMEENKIFGKYRNDYSRVLLRLKPSRLYILKDYIGSISEEKWKSVSRYGFSKENI